jgi:transposase InsO family protein
VSYPLKRICERAGMSRQNFYKGRKRRERKAVDEGLVKELVSEQRARQPRLGGLKLHKLLREELAAEGVRLGRDRFFHVLRNKGLLLEPLPRGPRTTNSAHNLPVYSNLIDGIQVTGPNQVWVSDITYIRTGERFAYLSLVTDRYSRKIVGYHLGQSLRAEDTLQALDMALRQCADRSRLIHHSDRGCQYCSEDYVQRLKDHGVAISMTQKNHCAENAMAERMNGILKQEYFLNYQFRTLPYASRAVDEAVRLYNEYRPHRALDFQTPDQVHRRAA